MEDQKVLHFKNYLLGQAYDEMFGIGNHVRQNYEAYKDHLESLSIVNIKKLQDATDQAQLLMGMTFQVHGDEMGLEKILKLDIIPRIIDGLEWEQLQLGLKQRIKALNLFINDIYHDQKVIKDGLISEEMIHTCPAYLPSCKGLVPSRGIWCHISGVDIIRDTDGNFCVLEDNLRCPSGVSYMLENRKILKATFPRFFDKIMVQPVSDYAPILYQMLEYISPVPNPTIVVLTPGIYNSAYYEHSYLAQEMGVELVEGRDLVVRDGHVYMRSTKGFRQVDVIYRRIDDTFMDPLAFNPDSMLGVPGIFELYRKGKVAIANAPGTGVADDKAICPYVPDFVRYYLAEEPIIANVPTYICSKPDDLKYVLENIEQLVVQETNAAGGYGMMIGPKSDSKMHVEFREKVKKNPRNYVAQPMINLSTVPCLTEENFSPRHVDLRPFVIYGNEISVIPGGLTRVALKEGSLVVNSSQGGGTKDTWIV
ncbi:MAG: circularly permuted type 2 ATP-grasp protein [Saprospiraceae bacterium]|nr:circularly permuted type 2 ATP-grasp protein [Saprospiraceae bacterium]